MTNVIAIYRRELRAYFDGPLAYIIVPIFLGLVGVFCLYFQDVFAAGLVNMKTVFFWMAIFYLLLVPALTMKAFSEEMRTGSLEMLVTLPISEEEMVLGKYLASVSLQMLQNSKILILEVS